MPYSKILKNRNSNRIHPYLIEKHCQFYNQTTRRLCAIRIGKTDKKCCKCNINVCHFHGSHLWRGNIICNNCFESFNPLYENISQFYLKKLYSKIYSAMEKSRATFQGSLISRLEETADANGYSKLTPELLAMRTRLESDRALNKLIPWGNNRSLFNNYVAKILNYQYGNCQEHSWCTAYYLRQDGLTSKHVEIYLHYNYDHAILEVIPASYTNCSSSIYIDTIRQQITPTLRAMESEAKARSPR